LQEHLKHQARELEEARDERAAIGEVLRVISTSPGELEPVFQAMLENATRICGASFGVLHRRDGDVLRTVAMHNAPPAYVERKHRDPVVRNIPHNDPIERVRATLRVIEVADAQEEDAYRGDTPGGAFARETGARSMLLVPMVKDNELNGIIAIYRLEVRPFTAKQIASGAELRRASRHSHREYASTERAAAAHW
jgi:GAF domain-containing protein